MRKFLVLAVIVFLLYACAVHKKPYYIFSRSIVQYGNVKEKTSVQKIEQPEQSLSTVDETTNKESQNDLIESGDEVRVKESTNKPIEKVGESTETTSPKLENEIVQTEQLTLTGNSIQPKNGNLLIYLGALLIGAATMGLIRVRKPVTEMTRWAKANPGKTQGLITGMHLSLLGLGLMSGYNLNRMGYEISNMAMYGFGATSVASLLAVPLFARHNTIAIPRLVNRQRLAFTGMVLSSLMMMTGFGNRIERSFPDTRFAETMATIDQSIYSDNNHETDPIKTDAKKLEIKKARMANAGMSAGGATLLTILLVILACAGICLMIGGVSAISTATPGAIAAIIIGAALLWISIKSIGDVARRRKAEKAGQP